MAALVVTAVQAGSQVKEVSDRPQRCFCVEPGRRPHLVVLHDDGTGKVFDYPDGTIGNTYVTAPRAIIPSDEPCSETVAVSTAASYHYREDPGEGCCFVSMRR
jgi:hypothetical protein